MPPKTIGRLVVLIAVLSFVVGLFFFLQRRRLSDRAQVAAEQVRRGDAGFREAEEFYQQYLSNLPAELREARVAQAARMLEGGLARKGEESSLRWMLANVAGERGETASIIAQIEELRKNDFASVGLQYLAAYYYLNSQKFTKARRLLYMVASTPKLAPTFKARVDDLVRRCHTRWAQQEARPLAAGAGSGTHIELSGK